MEHMLNRHQLHLFLWVSKQWGFTNNTGRPYITFPFKFSNVFTAISCICHNGSPSEANTVYNVSISGMNIGASGGGSGKYWCAFGVAQQQWGINTGGAVRTSTLPIPFTNVFLAVASTSSEWCCPGCSATNTTVTTRAYQSNRPDVAQPNDVNWIIIGCQPQWGYQTVHGTNPVTYDLPIPFEEAPFTVAISTGNSGNHASCGGFTKTTIVLRAGTTAGVWDTVGFFIIGCQLQWGIISNNKAIFPLVFNVFVSSALLLSRGSGTGTWYGDSSNTTLTGISCVTPDYVLSGTYIAIGA